MSFIAGINFAGPDDHTASKNLIRRFTLPPAQGIVKQIDVKGVGNEYQEEHLVRVMTAGYTD